MSAESLARQRHALQLGSLVQQPSAYCMPESAPVRLCCTDAHVHSAPAQHKNDTAQRGATAQQQQPLSHSPRYALKLKRSATQPAGMVVAVAANAHWKNQSLQRPVAPELVVSVLQPFIA